MKELRDNILLLLVVGMVVWGALQENGRRFEVSQTLGDMKHFMATGPRFPLQYGMSMCEHVSRLERGEFAGKPVDCDAMRHAITQTQSAK